MSRQFYLGVDGGTTRMEAAVIDESGRGCGRSLSGPINAGGGESHPHAREHLLEAVRGALADAGISGADLAGTCLCMSGWDAGWLPEARVWLAPLGLQGGLTVGEDGPGAWAAAGFPDPCVFVLLGTMSGTGGFVRGNYVKFPLNESDLDYSDALQAEGHVIGSKALAAAIMAETGEQTELLPAVLAHLGLSEVKDLIAWAAGHEGRRERAALCAVAADVARRGDRVAAELFTEAGRGAARAACKAARWQGTPEAAIVLAGNVWKAGGVIRRPFEAESAAGLPGASIVGPVDQAYGCALLARRSFGGGE